MKLALSLVLLFSASASFASSVQAGSYKSSHEIGLMFAGDAASCKENDGNWDAKEEFCSMEGGDTLTIKARKGSKLMKVEITAVGTNFHTCEFQGVGAQQNDGSIIAKAKSSIYNENGTETKTTCDLGITSESNGLKISILNNKEEACQQFCGMNMSLDGEGFVK